MQELECRRSPALVAGFALPFVVALAGAGMTVAGMELSAGRAYGLLALTLVGLPVVAVGAVGALPRSWPVWERAGLVGLYVPLLYLAAAFVAVTLFAIVHCAVCSCRM